jgi:hypothetical protein
MRAGGRGHISSHVEGAIPGSSLRRRLTSGRRALHTAESLDLTGPSSSCDGLPERIPPYAWHMTLCKGGHIGAYASITGTPPGRVRRMGLFGWHTCSRTLDAGPGRLSSPGGAQRHIYALSPAPGRPKVARSRRPPLNDSCQHRQPRVHRRGGRTAWAPWVHAAKEEAWNRPARLLP